MFTEAHYSSSSKTQVLLAAVTISIEVSANREHNRIAAKNQ